MVDTNYISSIVKILENPIHEVIDDNIFITKFRAQLPQIRDNRIITLVFWGNLAKEIKNFYQINDYIMVEGYLSLRKKTVLNSVKQKAEITVLKVYPFLLNDDHSINKI